MTEPTKERTTDGHAALTAKIAKAVACLTFAVSYGPIQSDRDSAIREALAVLK